MTADHRSHIESVEYGTKTILWRVSRKALGIAARRRMAEQDIAHSGNLQLQGDGPRRNDLTVFRKKLVPHPLHDRAKGWRDRRRFRTRELREHLTLAVALNELNRQWRREQTLERLSRHRAEDRVASNDDEVDICGMDILQHGLERREVAMNVIERGDPHGRHGLSITLVRYT